MPLLISSRLAYPEERPNASLLLATGSLPPFQIVMMLTAS